MSKDSGTKRTKIAAPKGTRDVYPEDMLRRRYLTETWRAVSVRHGFEEIDGPTFEQSELYAVKSGEGILGELFQAFSGKDPAEVEEVMRTGRGPYALRPEFTPTLARMYAARAKQLPKPTRWFCIPQFFRAERPQRGRLREFLQWNVDVVGDESRSCECDVLWLMVDHLLSIGLGPEVCNVHIGERVAAVAALARHEFPMDRVEDGLRVLDGLQKASRESLIDRLTELGQPRDQALLMLKDGFAKETAGVPWSGSTPNISPAVLEGFYGDLPNRSEEVGIGEWLFSDLSVVRGLAYYTGTVFELIAHGERAVAGGGRYDNLIELFGGPPTPAAGFAMGDVVLSLLLEEKGLMPEGAELLDAVERVQRSYSLRPDAFVVPNGDEDCEGLVTPLVAALRRGVESAAYREREGAKPWDGDRYDRASGGLAPMHARVTSKSTRNLKKLLSDAESQHARFAVVIHGADKVQLKDLDRREDVPHPTKGDFSVDPGAENYVGREISERLFPRVRTVYRRPRVPRVSLADARSLTASRRTRGTRRR